MTVGPYLLAVPNLSEGRRPELIREIAAPGPRALLLDVHSDPDHNRSVLTYAGLPDELVESILLVAGRASATLDIRSHAGVHPRHGVLDVLPFVALDVSEAEAARAADAASSRIASDLDIAVYRYGPGRPLPDLRRTLASDRPPPADYGTRPHPTAGVVCVGVRPPLVAFNVNLRGDLRAARQIARAVREALPHVRALGVELASRGLVQVSMNLVSPEHTRPRTAFDTVARLAADHQLDVVYAEIVGLVPDVLLGSLGDLPLRAPARGIRAAIEAASGR